MTKNLDDNFNLKDNLDINHNWILEKEELEKLWFKVSLSSLEKDAIDNAIKTATFIPENFRWEISKLKDPEEKKWYVFLLQFWEKELWKESFKSLTQQIPLKEVSLFLYELLKAEQQRDLLQNTSIILTNEEIKNLKENILTKNYTQKQLWKLQEFIKEQLEQNISSAELVEWTTLSKTLEKNNKDPKQFLENIDTISYKYFTDNIPNISKDTTRNMATGFTIALIKLYNQSNWNLPIFLNSNTILNNLKKIKLIKWEVNTWINFLDKIDLINKVINNNLNKKNSDKNELLMNPEKFSKFILKVVSNNLDEKNIKQEILNNQNDDNIKLDHTKIKENLKSIFNKAWENLTEKHIKHIWTIASLWEEIKKTKWWTKQWLKDNKSMLIEWKETLESIWIWKFFKKFINKILKFLWFKNGWDDIENKIEKNNNLSKYVVDYLKNTTSFENIQKDKTSIFHKGFENNLKDNSKTKINQIKVTWNIWWKTMYYLTSLWTDKNSIEKNLTELFKYENFKTTLKKANIKEEDFLKQVFSTKTEIQNKNKINIWTIDLTRLSNIIEKSNETEINEKIEKKAKTVEKSYASPQKTTLDNLPKNDKEKIKKLINKENTKMWNLVKKYFPNINFSYSSYLAWIWFIETENKYDIQNSIWAVWKYQFMPYTLKDYGITNIKNFKKNPYVQEQVMAQYTKSQFKKIANKIKWKVNSWADIAFYLAKAHLWGANAVLDNKSDGNISQNEYAQKATKIYKNIA